MTALSLLAFWVGVIMAALGFLALVGANQRVEDAKRRIRGERAARRVAEASCRFYERQQAARVVPLRESLAVDRITAILAANEAARADWDELGEWS